ncbi:MAG: hypothetical protein Kow00133_17140 [Amphiplicatus sp.]
MIRKTLAAALSAGALLAAAPAFAADEANVVPGLTAVGKPLGLHGVDPVAFVELGNRIEGTAAYTAVHEDVAYYFDSRANMDKFKRDPAAYVPANGGFCTFGVSLGVPFLRTPVYLVSWAAILLIGAQIFR